MATMICVTPLPNADLVTLAQGNDQSAWNELVDRYTRLVWHVVLGFHQLDRDSAADVHQTTWLRLAENLSNIRDPERLGAWLATTARRESLRVVAARQNEAPVPEVDTGLMAEPLERHMLDSERDTYLWAAFRELDESCQQLLRLSLADPPFSYDEISTLLDMKRGSVGPTRRRCLDVLKASIESYSKEDGS